MLITCSYKENIPDNYTEINVTSRGTDKWSELSPFKNRPIYSIDGLKAENMENLWQFSKVYPEHLDAQGNIKKSFYTWREDGFKNKFAIRYPKGKGIKPKFFLWGDKRLSYVEARKQVYFPVYGKSIYNTKIFNELLELYSENRFFAIRDFDVYRFDLLNLTLKQVIENPNKKAGHGFVVYHLLKKLIG